MDINEILKMMEKSLPDETLFAEVIRDLVKNEIESALKEKLDKNPEIKNQLRIAVIEYIEAKIKEISATTKFTEAVAKLGIISLPSELREEMLKSFISAFQKEITQAIDKTL
ncbi:MAG: hypothetical protein ACP5F1_04570 [Thermoplasmata archaeon]|nr:hypothetical protein [Thermoplasmata archaeon]